MNTNMGFEWFRRLISLSMLLGIVSLPAGCSKSQYTGRQQFIIMSPKQEMELGAQAYQEVISKAKISNNQRMTEVLNRVGQRIAVAAKQPEFAWEFNLIDSEQINAFCLPGGKIAFYTGILPILQNEAGMAVVMGHEVAHAMARHGGERMSQHLAAGVLEQVLKVGLGGADPQQRDTILKIYGAGSKVGVLLPFSRTHELEADQIGLSLAAKAGYDPREAVPLWQRMQQAGGKKRPPEFMSTHPAVERRIDELQALMPAALEDYEKAPQQYGLGQQLDAATGHNGGEHEQHMLAQRIHD